VAYRRLRFDGGVIEYRVDGPAEAPDLLLFHFGTPGGAVQHPGLVRAAALAGMRTAAYSRAGYAGSTRRPGRTIADEAAISAALADRLGHRTFFTVGWSGGGPPALACAALLPDRVKACMTMAGLAPRHEAGPIAETWDEPADAEDWKTLAGPDPDPEALGFPDAVAAMGGVTAQRLAADPRTQPRDRAALVGPEGVGPAIARAIRRALSKGWYGFFDDNVAQARDWGFRVADIRVPVVVRQGEVDRHVPVHHGRWLAATIPGARGVFLPGTGHAAVSQPWSEVVAQLVAAARTPLER
jgi:pimeloyl-ACP methyl ester carboxylesterase